MLYLFDPAHPQIRIPLGPRPRFVGRGASNDLVLDHPRVSGKHVSLWTEEGQVCIVDLGSSNGTAVDGAPVKGTVRRLPPFNLTLGDGPTLTVTAEAAGGEPAVWRLREVDSEVAVAVLSDRFTIGRDVVVPGLDPRDHVQLLVDSDGLLWHAHADDAEPLVPGVVLQVGATRWKVERAGGEAVPTELVHRTVYPYHVTVHPNAVEVTDGTRTCRIDAPNRYALMVVLARARARELAGDVRAGWVSDDALAVGVWGAAERARDPRLVLCRTRADLREAGLDPWCLEKRASGTRLRVQAVEG